VQIRAGSRRGVAMARLGGSRHGDGTGVPRRRWGCGEPPSVQKFDPK